MIRIFRAIVSAGVIAAAAPGAAQVVPVGAAGLLAMVGQGQYGKARDALRAAEHTDVDVLFLEAQILAHQGRLSEAVAAYRAILAANPGLTPVRQILAQTLFNMGDYDADNQGQITIPSGYYKVFFEAGHMEHMPAHVYVLCGDYALAVAQSERAVRADWLRVDERGWVYIAEESGHVAAYAPVPHLSLVR